MNRVQIITTLLGLIISGEAVALLFWVWVRHPHHPWLLIKNKLLLLTDVITGFMMSLMILHNLPHGSHALFTAALFVLLSTHLFRTLEYIGPAVHPFCFNRGLYCANVFKLLGIVFLPMIL